MTSPDLGRLAVLAKNRRTELRLGVEPAAKLAGISKDTWKRVEAGQKVWDRSYAGIDMALQWASGSCLRVLSGKDPITAEPIAGTDAKVADIPPSELEQQVGDAVQIAAIATRGDLTGDEVLALSRRVLEELRKRGAI